MENQEIDIIIASYLAGNATREEMETLRGWIEENPENARYFQRRREIWNVSATGKYDAGMAYSRFHRRVAQKRSDRLRRFALSAAISVAAAASVAVVAVVSFRQGEDTFSKAVSSAVVTLTAPSGSKISLVLPDGTEVWLNSGSVLSYNQSYGSSDRNITLSGEAFFSVIHNDRLPFVVNLKGGSVKDIGTKFNINAHENDDVISVYVSEGSAEVRNLLGSGNERAVLNANQTAEIDRTDGRMRIRRQNSLSPAEWVNGALVFDNATLSTIANELTRRYGVGITFSDEKLKQIRFYCYFVGKDYTVDDILSSLVSTGKVKCSKKGDMIRFY